MLIAIDPGHGGTDPGAVYDGRNEKDDVLRLAKQVGDLLTEKGVDVIYTREDDIYETPFRKAQDGNNSGADYFISFHRNSSEYPNQYSGAEVLVYNNSGVRRTLANNILDGMEKAGYKNLGIDERRDLAVLRRTNMPAVLIEAGFINNDADNRTFDNNFDELAAGIADGILKTIGYDTYAGQRSMEMNQNDYGEAGEERYYDDRAEEESDYNRSCTCQCPDVLYRVQVGAYRNRDSADRILNSLLVDEFPAFIVYDDGLYKVQVGAYRNLSNAIAMENRLRNYRYNTYITTM